MVGNVDVSCTGLVGKGFIATCVPIFSAGADVLWVSALYCLCVVMLLSDIALRRLCGPFAAAKMGPKIGPFYASTCQSNNRVIPALFNVKIRCVEKCCRAAADISLGGPHPVPPRVSGTSPCRPQMTGGDDFVGN